MQPLRFFLNVTLDGCYDHTVVIPSRGTHDYAGEALERSDALLIGRVTYELMEGAWREPARTGERPDWMEDWMLPFAKTIDRLPKHVVSTTLSSVDWNAQLVRGDLATAVRQLKQQPGRGIAVAGVQLAHSLAALGLIDEVEFVVHPRIAGQGPTLFAGLPRGIDLELTHRQELDNGAVALRYNVRR